jgi:hypothetical protein
MYQCSQNVIKIENCLLEFMKRKFALFFHQITLIVLDFLKPAVDLTTSAKNEIILINVV